MGRCQQSLTHYRLNRHGAVHQADTGVGGVAVDTGVGEGGVLVAAELQDDVVHLINANYRQLFCFIDENLYIFAPTKNG